MKRMLINATQSDELRVAITNNALLVDLDIERPGVEQKKANIYKGKITSIEPSLAAVFVNYGSERHGFLPLKEISPEYFSNRNNDSSDQPIDMNKVLKIGQQVVVQVDKEERGTKGAALTTFLSLAGSYLVLMPNSPRAGGISRRIEGEEREQLRETLSKLVVPEGMGAIIRTAGVNKTAEELQWDLDVLLKYFDAIKQAAAISQPAPYLIHQESDVVIRTLRDYLRQDIGEVIVDNKDAHERALNYIKRVRPDFADRIKHYNDSMPLFSRYQIEQQIETANQREVRLPSGGSIVIDQTEALVAIDINSARATKGRSIEETAVNTNVEAAEEIARQMRLRDIGGLIVIDFIDMTHTRNQRQVENVLHESLHVDRARIQIGRISRFGLLEMSRQRLRSAVHKSSRVPCPRCSGTGAIRSIESLGLSIIHLIQEQATKTDKAVFQVQLPIDVATFLINEQRHQLQDIEQKTGISITIVPNQHLQTPHYNIRQLRANSQSHDTLPSYKLIRSSKPEQNDHKEAVVTKNTEEPAMNQFLDKTQQHPNRPGGEGVVRRLLRKMFSTTPATTEEPQAPSTEDKPSANRQSGNQQRQQRRNNNSRNRNNQNRQNQRNRNSSADKNNERNDNNRNNRNDNRSNRNDNETDRNDNRGNRNDNRGNRNDRNDNRGNRNDNRTERNDDNRGNRIDSSNDRATDNDDRGNRIDQEQGNNTRARRGSRGGQGNKQQGNRNNSRRNNTNRQRATEQKNQPTNASQPTSEQPANKALDATNETPKQQTQNKAAASTQKPASPAVNEINALANENSLSKHSSDKPKPKASVRTNPVVQQEVSQRQMTAGRRISPETKKAAPVTPVVEKPKAKMAAGRKISSPSEQKKAQTQPAKAEEKVNKEG